MKLCCTDIAERIDEEGFQSGDLLCLSSIIRRGSLVMET
jgi:hypothetical protein